MLVNKRIDSKFVMFKVPVCIGNSFVALHTTQGSSMNVGAARLAVSFHLNGNVSNKLISVAFSSLMRK
jgi:Na+/phosphate symporter